MEGILASEQGVLPSLVFADTVNPQCIDASRGVVAHEHGGQQSLILTSSCSMGFEKCTANVMESCTSPPLHLRRHVHKYGREFVTFLGSFSVPTLPVLSPAGETVAGPKVAPEVFAHHLVSVSSKGTNLFISHYRRYLESLVVNFVSTESDTYRSAVSISEVKMSLSECSALLPVLMTSLMSFYILSKKVNSFFR
ncbi:hypothetical protein E2C01_038357 [Portunus trituberculatus]|uniref:Uncharacterized protein n=1 Tax=Portunus trituberculatus TaxID=210409 RepID=A0A5B7FHJ8_PORTR|nr:hypothetical protein [Portunus trituberculatus]